ncbi:SRPBCC family protein [Aquimarina rhabdastrellae]
MKIVKYLFLLLLIVIIGGATYIATINGKYDIAESKVITAPDELLFTTVNEYKTWETWGPWMDLSNDFVMSYPTQTSGEGASYSWTSASQGDGHMKTVATAPFSSIDQKLTFITPMGESISDVYWTLEATAEGTKITWGMKGDQSFFDKAYWATQDISMEESLRPMLKNGLEKLATYTQTQMQKYAINVDGITEHGGGFYVYSSAASTIATLPQKMEQMIPALKAYVHTNKLPQTGMPFTLFNEFNAEAGTTIFSIGIPVREKIEVPEESSILCNFLPKQKVVKTTLTGDYKNLKEAWAVAQQYITDNGLELNPESPPFEVYRTQPDIQQNPANWITEIYIPIL